MVAAASCTCPLHSRVVLLQLQWSQQRPSLHPFNGSTPFSFLYNYIKLYTATLQPSAVYLAAVWNHKLQFTLPVNECNAQPRLHQPAEAYNKYHHFQSVRIFKKKKKIKKKKKEKKKKKKKGALPDPPLTRNNSE